MAEDVRARMGEVEREILARSPEHDLVPTIERISEVCGLLGDPQKAFRAVHVTGTNGKTSTTRLAERLMREHGLRTGRFTSPHLVDIRERIAIDGRPLPAGRFVATYDDVAPYVDLVDQRSLLAGRPRMTFFELLVAMAYAAFADAPVEVAAVEVGMGGSWDATNVLDAQVGVVMPVALDHQRFLGHDLASIAREKAGIIKPGSVAVLADQPPEAAAVLLRRCAEVGATPLREGVEFGVTAREIAVGGQMLSLTGRRRYDDVFLPLYGEHQARNAACAVAAVEALLGVDGQGLDPDVVRVALADVDSPGRLEVVRGGPTVLVDAAHNPAGAAVLADAVRESFSFTRLVGIVGILADKDAEGILGALEPLLDEVVVTRSSSPRSIDPDELAEIAVEVFGDDRVDIAQRIDDAIDVAIGRAEEGGLVGGGVLATGSVTVAADVRRRLVRR
ncbi:MAG TPA: folylpolyglutamate synthase/dihydrofolate synthase family protein [Kineosporiaceae bacterium]|nr:folylpolyglutamate synthase/dihydrofolate synthase family protein [Kineosporiaceae bacterium]